MILHPVDQAAGLRQLFAASRTRFVPVLANPHVAFGGLLLERLATACNALGLHATVVDASDQAPNPREIATVELTTAIEHLSPNVSYLAARGLPISYVDSGGSTAAFLQSIADAAPQTNVVLLHASAYDLVRLFARRRLRCLLLASDHPDSVTHAYAGLKLLAQRGGLMVHDLLLAADRRSPRVPRITSQLARCADEFIGAVLHGGLTLDPVAEDGESPCHDLLDFVRDLLAACEPGAVGSTASDFHDVIALPGRRPMGAGMPATSSWALH